MFAIRDYQPVDAPALLALFKDTIRRVNCRDYSPEQIDAWASNDIDPITWAMRFAGRSVFVAVSFSTPNEPRIVGFADLEPNGHLDRFYVSADHQRCGIGRTLINAVVAKAQQAQLTRIFTEASITALPFFLRHGFVGLAAQTVVVRGVSFLNYRMERVLRL